MKGDPVPDPDHILRYVGGVHVDTDADGATNIMGGGFIARPQDNNCPSYNWLEFLEGSLEEQIQQVRLGAASSGFKYGSTAKLVRLNVGRVRQHIKDGAESHEVTVIHDPRSTEERPPHGDPSHALMTNVPDATDPMGELIGDLIRQCIVGIYPARAPSPG
jgi:hypothetical protein